MPTNGRWPVSSSYSTMPALKTSERGSTALPMHCSGDMYDGVPITMPVSVRFDMSTRATPKSATLSSPVGVTIRFDGLMSRWTTPQRCANSSASSSWVISATSCAKSNEVRRVRYSRSPVPSTYSITM